MLTFTFPFQSESGWSDLNRRPLRPKRSALADCATPRADKSIIRTMLKRQDNPVLSHFTLLAVLFLIVFMLSACQSQANTATPATARLTETPKAQKSPTPENTSSPTATPTEISPTPSCMEIGGRFPPFISSATSFKITSTSIFICHLAMTWTAKTTIQWFIYSMAFPIGRTNGSGWAW